MKQKKSKNRQKLFIGFVFLLGLGIFLFPNLSNLYSQYSHAMIILSYQKNQEETDDQLKELELERFQAYNESLSDAGKDYVDPFAENEAEPINRSPEVDERLGDPLGHIEVPKIGIDIPIYDGTTDYILQRGIGLLGNSSMPVGGVGTHAALTGHRGLPNAELFSNIVDLVEGDLFYIHSAGGILAYQVQTIKTVLPHETESLKIQAGKDLVTLITCTPYMVNSHRLLITGIRIPYVAPLEESPLTTQKIMKKVAENHSYLGVYLASIFVLVSMVFFYIHRRKKGVKVMNKRRKNRSLWLFNIGVLIILLPQMRIFYQELKIESNLVAYQNSVETVLKQEEFFVTNEPVTISSSKQEPSVPIQSFDYSDPFINEVAPDYLSVPEVYIQEEMIGYIDIPKIGERLPIYYGATNEHLAKGIATVSGTSFPLGGESTHAVLSGHRGYAGANYFRHIDLLLPGDRFTVTMLKNVLTYEVVGTEIGSPDDPSPLEIKKGEDWLTLLSCHPYRINNQRIFVHAKRVLANETAIYTAHKNLIVSATASYSGLFQKEDAAVKQSVHFNKETIVKTFLKFTEPSIELKVRLQLVVNRVINVVGVAALLFTTFLIIRNGFYNKYRVK